MTNVVFFKFNKLPSSDNNSTCRNITYILVKYIDIYCG